MSRPATRSTLSRRVLKLMSLFSGIQGLSILCSVVKMKLVTLWLGATGVGLFGIYQSVVDTVATVTDMGLRQSAVRDVANSATSPSLLARVAAVVRRWSILSALLGAVAMAALALPAGIWFFGSPSGCWGFLLLSTAMFLNALTGGEQALLQGSGKLKALASANLWGTLAGLAMSIPLFRWCGNTGVVLSIVAYALAMAVAMHAARLRAPRPSPALGLRQIWEQGKGFARLGLCMALATFITSLAHTIFIGLLNSLTSTAQVGLVQAGDTLVVRYIGLIFVAIGMEFYPRVAANSHRTGRLRVFVNHEITLLLLVLTPLLILFILLRRPVVTLLYSQDFLPIVPFISWAALSSIPKALSWCLAYCIVAKGDGRAYILTEGLDALVSVPLCLYAFTHWGLPGLGVAYIVWYLVYLLLVAAVCSRRYGLLPSRRAALSTLASFSAATLFLLAMDHAPLWVTLPLGAAIIIPCLHALRRLLRR